jgi:hypothetical protein
MSRGQEFFTLFDSKMFTEGAAYGSQDTSFPAYKHPGAGALGGGAGTFDDGRENQVLFGKEPFPQNREYIFHRLQPEGGLFPGHSPQGDISFRPPLHSEACGFSVTPR